MASLSADERSSLLAQNRRWSLDASVLMSTPSQPSSLRTLPNVQGFFWL
ncbi:hypothetical protein HUG15_08480 [Salicibibacter cibarius]|uniref:Uncharacterized protein n=1 Tax=Salicibibacter cibarius TaxID=2743000 RepID=A0A7T6Z266_9BACI|nr:hypothetical protein [Salicibibacter cibarius]QQK75595.1 hypothetical protein HUG15_08480 [Salicibibacter cibarius]